MPFCDDWELTWNMHTTMCVLVPLNFVEFTLRIESSSIARKCETHSRRLYDSFTCTQRQLRFIRSFPVLTIVVAPLPTRNNCNGESLLYKTSILKYFLFVFLLIDWCMETHWGVCARVIEANVCKVAISWKRGKVIISSSVCVQTLQSISTHKHMLHWPNAIGAISKFVVFVANEQQCIRMPKEVI